MGANYGYDDIPLSAINKTGSYNGQTPIAPYRDSYMWSVTIIFVVIAAHAISGCTAKLALGEPPPTIANVSTTTYPHCSSDRRGQYTIVEVPEITDTGQAPRAFFSLLHEAIMEEGRQRDIYRVVPATSTRDEVVLLTMFVESWTPDAARGGNNGLLLMKLFLIDKIHQCQVGQTTGHGDIRHDPETGFNPEDIRAIAESAGWFVGITLMHDP